jgi:hypothetical protein
LRNSNGSSNTMKKALLNDRSKPLCCCRRAEIGEADYFLHPRCIPKYLTLFPV